MDLFIEQSELANETKKVATTTTTTTTTTTRPTAVAQEENQKGDLLVEPADIVNVEVNQVVTENVVRSSYE